MTEQKIDRNKLTFSQAEGIDPLPQPLALGMLPESARGGLWNNLYQHLCECRCRSYDDEAVIQNPHRPNIIGLPWREILYDHHVHALNQAADEFKDEFDAHIDRLKELFLKGPYNEIFYFLQFVMRHESAPNTFSNTVAVTLRTFSCAYTVVDGDTIFPIGLPEERESFEKAFAVLKSGPFEGARLHLHKSAKCINEADHAGSVRESIHAVESIARRLDPKAANSLKKALKALQQHNVALHDAFKDGIEKLYGYTSDEEGIRHALIEDEAKVDEADALFMFGACASFSAYLVNKARKAGLSIEK